MYFNFKHKTNKKTQTFCYKIDNNLFFNVSCKMRLEKKVLQCTEYI